MIAYLLVFLVATTTFVFSAIIPLVTIPDGQIGGREYVTENNKTYYAFQRIPYAAPPVGQLRFEAPEPPQRWNGILDGTEDNKGCISITFLENQDAESEDCLYLNVYTPCLTECTEKKLPVMFWIHGGGFTQGNDLKSTYGPDFLVEEDVILITHQYRLGPLGFLSTGDEVLPGNNGLKDQNMALNWTQANIKYFGGDPDKVTIFGQSAGAVSVASHVLSTKSKGLFRAAIMESASALVPWALDVDPKVYTHKFAEKIGYHGNSSQELKTLLKNSSVKDIHTATYFIKLDWPVLEVKHEGAFLSESNYALLHRGNFNKVPTMLGICSEESLTFLFTAEIAKAEALSYDLNAAMVIPSDLYPAEDDKVSVIQQIRDLYLKENETLHTNVAAFAEYITDDIFARGIIKHAELQSAFTPVYLYQFAYYGRSFIPAFIDGAERVGHASEIPFLFKGDAEYDTNKQNDLLAQNRLVKLWSNFAKYLDPTPERSELLDNILWPAIGSRNFTYLNINETLEVRMSLKAQKYLGWEKIYDQYGTKPFIIY